MDRQLVRFSLSSSHIYIHPPVLLLVYDLCALRCTQTPEPCSTSLNPGRPRPGH